MWTADFGSNWMSFKQQSFTLGAFWACIYFLNRTSIISNKNVASEVNLVTYFKATKTDEQPWFAKTSPKGENCIVK